MLSFLKNTLSPTASLGRDEAGASASQPLLTPTLKRPASEPPAWWSHYEAPLANGEPSTHGRKHEAQVGSTMAPIESLDYEIVQSDVYQEDWLNRTGKSVKLEYSILKWVFASLIGIGTALTAFAINMAVENVAGFKFIATVHFMEKGHYIFAFLLYAAMNVALVGFAATLCVFVAPAAAGSGIPEVKSYLNGIDTPSVLAPLTLFTKVVGSVGSVAGGLAVGKEGPLVHTGACIAAWLSMGGSDRFGLRCLFLRLFKNDRDRRDLVTCGAIAGVAAAFRAPVGGVLFALEEATSWWRSHLLWRGFFTAAVVAVTLRAAMAACGGGRCGYFGDSGFIIFDQEWASAHFGLLELIPVVILGVTGGVMGGIFNSINVRINLWRRDSLSKKGRGAKVLEACLVAFLTSAASYGLPWLVSCVPCPDPKLYPTANCPQHGRSGSFRSFHCPAGTYNDLANLIFATNENATRNLFSGHFPDQFRVSSLLLFLGAFYVLAVITYGAAVPSGLFVPAILTGSTYGRIVGKLMWKWYPGRVDEGTYALLGAASFLGGSMRMTVSLCVILIELTGNLEMLPLIMLVLLVSKAIGDLFGPAIYDMHLIVKRMPIMEAFPENFYKYLVAKDALNAKPVVTLRPVERVQTILQALKTTRHNAFVVVDDGDSAFADSTVHGLILRQHLLILLKTKVDFRESREMPELCDPNYNPHATQLLHKHLDFGKPASGHLLTPEKLDIKPEEMEKCIDLRPFVNKSPHKVTEDTSLDQVYTLFRTLGLRHLMVIPRATRVVGVLTRKDLLPEAIEEHHPEAVEASTHVPSLP